MVALGFWLNRDLDHRLWEGHCFQNHWSVHRAECVAGCCILQATQCDDVARKCFCDFITVIGVHDHHTADALFLALGGVQEGIAFFQFAGINPCEGQRPYKGVIPDFERQRREGHVIIRTAGNVTGFCLIAGFEAHVIDNIERAGQIIHNSVQQGLHTFVLKCRATKNRHECHIQCALADQFAQCWNVRLIAFQIFHHGFIILLNSRFNQFGAPFVCCFFQLGTNWSFDP